MKILSAEQIRSLDEYTIEHEPIASIDLMERAAGHFSETFLAMNSEVQETMIFCGPGNNGGDGVAIARYLLDADVHVHLIICHIGQQSEDCKANIERIKYHTHPQLQIIDLEVDHGYPVPDPNDIVIDALFGTGLSRPIEGYWAGLIKHLNEVKNPICSVDVPSGLYPDGPVDGAVICADQTISFEVPKLAFFCPENHTFIGELAIIPIGLHAHYLSKLETQHQLIGPDQISQMVKTRSKYDHKGVFGHGLIIAGSQGKMGAALLAGKAALRSGIGLLTLHVPSSFVNLIHTALPEAMVSIDQDEFNFSSIEDLEKYHSIGVGCGLSTEKDSARAIEMMVDLCQKPIVFDADALNILAANQEYMKRLPKDSILTPHFKEFERLFGPSKNHFERLEKAREGSIKYGVYIILKGANTAIVTPEGNIHFNTTGNPGMATAGSGDVLTGILTSLLAQGYSSLDTSIIGVFIHGLAGDLAAEQLGQESLIASDIIDHLGEAFLTIHEFADDE